jgi:hypothetical protein
VKTGDIRIAFGTTETLGTGLNIQDNGTDITHVDTQFRPMDEEQRNGRFIRQGNRNKEVGIWKFGVKRTMDSILNDLNAKKQKFITQAQTEDMDREFDDPADDSTISFQSMAAAFSGNPRHAQLFALRQDVRSLEGFEDDWSRRKKSTRDALGEIERGRPKFDNGIAITRKTIKNIRQRFPDKAVISVQRGNGTELTGDAAKKELESITAGTLGAIEAKINEEFANGGLLKKHAEWLNDPKRKWFGRHNESRSIIARINGIETTFNIGISYDLDDLKNGALTILSDRKSVV